MEEAYNLANDLRVIFRNKKLDKEAAKVSFTKWYGKVAKSTLREIKSVKDTIKQYEDEILNYFDKRDKRLCRVPQLQDEMLSFKHERREGYTFLLLSQHDGLWIVSHCPLPRTKSVGPKNRIRHIDCMRFLKYFSKITLLSNHLFIFYSDIFTMLS